MPPSLLLCLDTSGRRLQAGLCLATADPADPWLWQLDEPIDHQRTHSGLLMPLLQAAFADRGLSPSDIAQVAVHSGPGSFTGIRAGVTVVRSLGQWLPSVAVFPCHGFDLQMAAGLAHFPAEWRTVACVQDARRGNVYRAVYAIDKDNSKFREQSPPCMVPLADIADTLSTVDGWLVDPALRPHWPDDDNRATLWTDTLPPLWSPQAMRTLIHTGQVPPVDWAEVFPLYLQPPAITLKPTQPAP
jgi:tRNA threonylcarbamoyl adenosine modification protein YeaZ